MVKTTYRKLKHIHMIGIGGTGMNGIAEVLINLGYKVSGSDSGTNEATARLIRLGAKVAVGHPAENVRGADVVEVLPDLDHAHITATLAATIAWEILALIACDRPLPEAKTGARTSAPPQAPETKA